MKLLRKMIKYFFRPKMVSYKQLTYLKEDGSFDYEQYRRIQNEGNKLKLDRSWATKEQIVFLSSYLKSKIPNPTLGICHGTRRGLEQKWFADCLHCKTIGTEIADSANQFPNTIQWDFHEEKPDWVGAADFVYSNSLDHAYDPAKALKVWMRSLKPNGVCIIEHTVEHTAEYAKPLDPFGVSLDVFPYLVLVWSDNSFSVREVLTDPSDLDNGLGRRYLVLQNN